MTNEQLVTLIKAGVDTAENMRQLYEQTRAFIHKAALKYQPYAELDDLEQEGYLALYDAIDGYDPAAGCLFLTYARHWIRQRIVRYIQNNGTVRLPVHEWEKLAEYRKLEGVFLSQVGRKPAEREISYYLGISLKQVRQLEKAAMMGQIGSLDSCLTEDGDMTVGDMVAGTEDVESTVLDEVEAGQLRAAVWGAVDSLEGNQREVIRARYQRGQTLDVIGKQLGVSRERVRNIESKALRELRRPSRSRQLRPFLPEAVGSMAYTGNGVEAFNRTWTSSTERIAMKL